jgi:hypothetical protein
MNMTKAEMESYLNTTRRHYGELDGKKAKGSFLDQFCETTGMCRKNAIRRLSPRELPHGRREVQAYGEVPSGGK